MWATVWTGGRKKKQKIIEKFQPKCLAIEKLFFAGNQKTVMLVSEARGVIIYEAIRAELSVREFTPLEMKVAVTGYGRSDKSQIKQQIESPLTKFTKLVILKVELFYFIFTLLLRASP